MRFLFGFLTASLVWALVAALLYATERIAIVDAAPDDVAPQVASVDEEPPRQGKRRRRARTPRPERQRREGSASVQEQEEEDAREVPTGEATRGDDLDWDGERSVDMAGGEAQLSGKQIEAGFDAAMGKIRRCLVLVPGDGDVTGKLVFGMRVASDGTPRAVNLSGPAAVTQAESGSCLRAAAQGIRFAAFDGPDMLFRYPITLH